LDQGQEWSDAQRKMALDLLGVPSEFRTAPTVFDPTTAEPSPTARIEHARSVVVAEIGRLERKLRDVLEPLDRLEREAAEDGVRLESDPEIVRLAREESASHRKLTWAVRRLEGRRRSTRLAETDHLKTDLSSPPPAGRALQPSARAHEAEPVRSPISSDREVD